MIRTHHAVVAALAAFGALAACGSSSSNESASSANGSADGGGEPGSGDSSDASVYISPDAAPPAATCTPPLAAADVSHPTTVVGTGTAASCTQAALASAIATGGIVTFDCGGATTLSITAEIAVPTDRDTVIDGGGTITLDGGSSTRILNFKSGDYRGMYGGAQHVLTVQNIIFATQKQRGR